jgi:nitrogen-specific signal transduction histidine kinase
MRTREIDRLLALADRLTEKGACGAALAILRVAEKAQVEREAARQLSLQRAWDARQRQIDRVNAGWVGL